MKTNMVLDSGAFSGWKQDDPVDIDKYIAFAKANAQYVTHIVNLDQIPGRPGQRRSQEDVEESARKSYENLKYMQKHGLKPMPVFHQGERFYWLDKLIAEGEDYIGISPMADLPVRTTRKWLDQVYTRITDKQGRPTIQTHGFGVTSFELLLRYPWTSCDSTSWVLIAGYGKIFMARHAAGQPRYDVPPIVIRVSGRQANADAKSEHSASELRYETMGPLMKKCVQDYVARVGLDMMEVKHTFQARVKVNVHFYKEFAEQRGDVVFKHRLTEVHR